MKNKSKENVLFQGFVEPLYYNSDGKTIGFSMSSQCGSTVILNADHKVKRLRKLVGKRVAIIGDYCRKRNFFTVKKISAIMSDLDKTLL